MAGALVDLLPATAGGEEDEDPPDSTPARRRSPALLAVLGAVVLLVAGGVAWVVASRSEPTPRDQPGAMSVPGCDVAVGVLDGALAAEPVAADVRSRLVATFRGASEGASIGCPVGPAYRWQAVAVQN